MNASSGAVVEQRHAGHVGARFVRAVDRIVLAAVTRAPL